MSVAVAVDRLADDRLRTVLGQLVPGAGGSPAGDDWLVVRPIGTAIERPAPPLW